MAACTVSAWPWRSNEKNSSSTWCRFDIALDKTLPNAVYWKLPKGRRAGIKDVPIREMQHLLEDYEKRRSWYSLVICTMKTITIHCQTKTSLARFCFPKIYKWFIPIVVWFGARHLMMWPFNWMKTLWQYFYLVLPVFVAFYKSNLEILLDCLLFF